MADHASHAAPATSDAPSSHAAPGKYQARVPSMNACKREREDARADERVRLRIQLIAP